MKLGAIFNVFDGTELLKGSMARLKGHVDHFIIVHQVVSNFGEMYDGLAGMDLSEFNPIFIAYHPKRYGGALNETTKRNLGIEKAKELGCTHFIQMDCDEYYWDFGKAKEQYLSSGMPGSVCELYTYICSPYLRCDKPDGYYVPFIHQLRPNSCTGVPHYPFHVDPTRKINETNVVIIEEKMDHFSWVRRDIERKVKNSSAKNNIMRGKIWEDWDIIRNLPAEKVEGFYVRDWDRKLTIVPNRYEIKLWD